MSNKKDKVIYIIYIFIIYYILYWNELNKTFNNFMLIKIIRDY